MLYFAYGSNLDPGQMKARCNKADVVGIAVLRDHELCFPRLSKTRKCGVSSVIPSAGKHTWGVVYKLWPKDADALDRHEGFKIGRDASLNSYNRVEISVLINDVATTVNTYIATPQDNPPLPSVAYLRHIRQGARHHKLPDDYVALLDLLVGE
ncbi:gamma-glutamylcyclotransferase family protein [Mesorhizobium sp.]|uniref:gamma-glutamylcyclotransferase family protein n=1 Tax=Mesorhizobium sp. TaxID=1871066 RepID=UPI000FEA520E|nr:gamma-glutamylcyclotransferase family protein [Mesorhizobium sp.]RWQ30026.1 MAG: gamma-glutamylcyclotransferase [Mesorhizobium sp.]